ncbi:ribose 5-phosphate isomerase B [Bacteroidota bacterium]
MQKLNIAIAADHAGYSLKEKLKSFLEEMGHKVEDYGPFSDDRVDYPDFAHPLTKDVQSGKYNLGITLCGSGNGINMVANKYKDIRSAICWSVEIAELARQHNDANICAIPARFVSEELAKNIVVAFLNTNFDGGRHLLRINKINIT